MIKKFLFLAVLSLDILSAWAQPRILPLKEWKGYPEKPLVLYISGDGGLNRFSLNLCDFINQSGYSVTAIDAGSYFRQKKTPEQSVLDISTYLNQQFNLRSNQDLVFIGSSFGADVLPFIINQLPLSLKNKLGTTFLISPSTSTDFETHWTDRLGFPIKRSMDVVAEINKISGKKIITIFGEDESDFPEGEIKITRHLNIILPGGHHLNGDVEKLGRTIVEFL